MNMREIMSKIQLDEGINDSKIFRLIYELDLAFEKINITNIPDEQRNDWIAAKKAIENIVNANPIG